MNQHYIENKDNRFLNSFLYPNALIRDVIKIRARFMKYNIYTFF